jgi:hypothetical protein
MRNWSVVYQSTGWWPIIPILHMAEEFNSDPNVNYDDPSAT